MTEMTINQAVEKRKVEFLKKQAHNELIQKQVEINRVAFKEATQALEIGQKALQFLEDLSMSRRNLLKNRIEGVITEGLRLIYGPQYSVELTYSIKNNRSCCEIEVVKKYGDYQIRRKVIDGNGGGVADTISVPLRLLLLVSSRNTERVVFLDEAYKHVGSGQIELVAEFLNNVCEQLQIQMILCTHYVEELSSFGSSVQKITCVDGVSSVEQVS